MSDDALVMARMVADLRWLAEARSDYLKTSSDPEIAEQVRVSNAIADLAENPTTTLLFNIIDGDQEAAHSWLPSWRYAEWDQRQASNKAAEDVEDAIITATCDAYTWSWEHYAVNAVDGYWIRCHQRGPHETHWNEDTDLEWK